MINTHFPAHRIYKARQVGALSNRAGTMPFELSLSFLTGIDHLDDDHRLLVAQINALEELEQTKDKQRLLIALARFMADLADHFSAEEANLRALKYPRLSSHAEHHTETVVTLKQLMVDLDKGDSINSNVTHQCLHELVSAILRIDMEFVNWLAARPPLPKTGQ